MDHRQYFDQHAEKWDTYQKPDESKLRRVVSSASIEVGNRVLDVGTGTGILLPLLVKSLGRTGSIVALDISLEMLKRAQAKGISDKISYVQADVKDTPFKGSSFDRVICFASFPHFVDKLSALVEIARILKEVGVLVIAHATSREKVNKIHSSIGGVLSNDLIPEDSEMKAMLKKAGFEDIVIFDEPDFYLVWAKKSKRFNRETDGNSVP